MESAWVLLHCAYSLENIVMRQDVHRWRTIKTEQGASFMTCSAVPPRMIDSSEATPFSTKTIRSARHARARLRISSNGSPLAISVVNSVDSG